jgi:hypothetical protein
MSILLQRYLYFVFSPVIRGFLAYFTPVHVLYIVGFGPRGIQVAIPNKYMVIVVVKLYLEFQTPWHEVAKIHQDCKNSSVVMHACYCDR